MDEPTYTVGQVAGLAGVTVRTLHHYDEIGLQRVLSWRELGFDLEQVAALVATDGSGAAVQNQLRAQHSQLLTRIERLQAVAATVAKTLEAHEMGINLTPAEMLEVFGEHDPAEHVEEAKQRWGDTDGYREAHRRTSSYGKEEWLQIRREGDAIPAQFAAAMQAGHPADSPKAAAAAAAHREHISRWFYEVMPEAHMGLAQMYVADPRFTATYDDLAPGLAQYVSDAILALYR